MKRFALQRFCCGKIEFEKDQKKIEVVERVYRN